MLLYITELNGHGYEYKHGPFREEDILRWFNRQFGESSDFERALSDEGITAIANAESDAESYAWEYYIRSDWTLYFTKVREENSMLPKMQGYEVIREVAGWLTIEEARNLALTPDAVFVGRAGKIYEAREVAA